MKPSILPEALARILQRVDFAGLATAIRLREDLGIGFQVDPHGSVTVGPDCGLDPVQGPVALRHALELSLLLRLWPDQPVLAGLAAARTAALFSALERPAPASGAPALPALSAMAASVPADAELHALWPMLSHHQCDAPTAVPPGVPAALRRAWPVLGPAEWLMQTGGDARLSVDPATGLNGYGCSHRPRPWAVTFASSTASSSSERGYGGAEAMRQQILRATLGGNDAVAGALDAIRAEIAALYGLPHGSLVALAPSGTDGELFATAVAQLHPDGLPLTVVLVAPEETGSGVPLAAAGRHFAADTARGVAVVRGGTVEGFRADTRVETVTLRDPAGHVRPPADVTAECGRIADAAVAAGRRVLLHRVDVSKTGLLAPDCDGLKAIQARHRGQVDVVVDACQARLSAGRVRSYLAQGWMVLLTGSKFLTGPPFAGAAVFPAAMAERFSGQSLPAGLRDYSGRAEWPPALPAAAALLPGGNAGLALRWAAALAELRAFDAVGNIAKHYAVAHFTARVCHALRASSDFHLIEVPPLRRGSVPRWDELRTILSFAIRHPETGGWMDCDTARRVYTWLNADLSPLLPDSAGAELRRLAHRRFHSGQPAKLALAGQEAGVLRVSVGARLVSGEPSHASLPPQESLDREIGDAVALLGKVSLILRHWARLNDAAPAATYN